MPRGLVSFVGEDLQGMLGDVSRYIADPVARLAGRDPDLGATPTDVIIGTARSLGDYGHLQLYFETSQQVLDLLIENRHEYRSLLGRKILIKPAPLLETEPRQQASPPPKKRVTKIMIEAKPHAIVLDELHKFFREQGYTLVQHDGLLAQTADLDETGAGMRPPGWTGEWVDGAHIHLIRAVCDERVTDVQVKRALDDFVDVGSYLGVKFSTTPTRLGETLDSSIFGASAPQSEVGYIYVLAYVNDTGAHLLGLTNKLFKQFSFAVHENGGRLPVCRSSARRLAGGAVMVMSAPGDFAEMEELRSRVEGWGLRKDIARVAVVHSTKSPTHYRDNTGKYDRYLVQTWGPNRGGVLAAITGVFEQRDFRGKVRIAEFDGNSDSNRYEGGHAIGARQVFGLIVRKGVDVGLLTKRLEQTCAAVETSVSLTKC